MTRFKKSIHSVLFFSLLVTLGNCREERQFYDFGAAGRLVLESKLEGAPLVKQAVTGPGAEALWWGADLKGGVWVWSYARKQVRPLARLNSPLTGLNLAQKSGAVLVGGPRLKGARRFATEPGDTGLLDFKRESPPPVETDSGAPLADFLCLNSRCSQWLRIRTGEIQVELAGPNIKPVTVSQHYQPVTILRKWRGLPAFGGAGTVPAAPVFVSAGADRRIVAFRPRPGGELGIFYHRRKIHRLDTLNDYVLFYDEKHNLVLTHRREFLKPGQKSDQGFRQARKRTGEWGRQRFGGGLSLVHLLEAGPAGGRFLVATWQGRLELWRYHLGPKKEAVFSKTGDLLENSVPLASVVDRREEAGRRLYWTTWNGQRGRAWLTEKGLKEVEWFFYPVRISQESGEDEKTGAKTSLLVRATWNKGAGSGFAFFLGAAARGVPPVKYQGWAAIQGKTQPALKPEQTASGEKE